MKKCVLSLVIGSILCFQSFSQATVEAFQSGGSLEIGQEVSFVLIYKTLSIPDFTWIPTPVAWDISGITLTNGNNASLTIIDDGIPPANMSPGATLTLTVTGSPLAIRVQVGAADITFIFEAFALPVELTAFSGELDEQDVRLYWETASETDNAGFVVERSYDGERFEAIGSLTGAGTTTYTQDYQFTDAGVREVALNHTAYYRLRQVDFDGNFTFSDLIAIDLNIEIEAFHISRINGWNSVDKQLQVYYHTTRTTRKLEVLVASISGLVVDQFYVYPEEGFNLLELDMSNQRNGAYVVSINNGKEIIARQIVLQDDY